MKNDIVEICKNTLQFVRLKLIYAPWYTLNTFKKLKRNKLCFLVVTGEGLPDNYALLCDALKKDYDLDIRVHYILEDRGSLSRRFKLELKFLADAADSKYIIFNNSSVVQGCFKKRKGSRIMNVWHAAGAFKKFDYQKPLLPLHPKYDYVPVSSHEVAPIYADAFGSWQDINRFKADGLCRSDLFFDPQRAEAANKHLTELIPDRGDKKIILYAPTFRGDPAEATAPDCLDISLLKTSLSDRYILICKYHPQTKGRPKLPEDCSGFAYDMSEDMSIDELLFVSDICITDYSSLIFEYSLLEKPMLFFAYDYREYEKDPGFYFPYRDFVPGPVCETSRELTDHILRSDFSSEKIRAFRERFMGACDGHSRERIIKNFFGKDIEKYRKDGSPDLSLEVLMVTMNRDDMGFLDSTGVRTDVLVANQCDRDGFLETEFRGKGCRMISKKDRGVGKNRNVALDAAKGDILLFADDDNVLREDYEKHILEAFTKLPDADMIIFDAAVKGPRVPSRNIRKTGRVGVHNFASFGAFQIAVRRSSWEENRVYFSELFGGGARYGSGEDVLFTRDCLRRGYRIYTYPAYVVDVNQESSTWFKSYGKKFFYDEGALVAALYPEFKHLAAIYFCYKFSRHSKLSFAEAYRLMLRGMRSLKGVKR